MSDDIVHPTLDDPLLIGAAEGLGGSTGSHQRDAWGWWTPLRVILVVLGGSLIVGYLQKLPCRDVSRWKDQFAFSHVCYTDVVASWSAYGLDKGQVPLFDFFVPYPPLTAAVMEVAAVLARAFPSDASASTYFDITVVLLAVFAIVAVVTTALLASRRRPWDALMVALSPVLILQAFTNWDLVALALLGLAMVAWSRSAPAWAGVWLGLATATKFWPLLMLLVLVMLCWRAGRLRDWLVIAGATVAAWAAVSVPVMLRSPDGFLEFWRVNISRGPDWDSLWLALGDATGWDSRGEVSNMRVGAVLLVLTLAVAVLVLKAPRRPRVPQVMFVLLALFLVFGKVFSPQDALWLTPLAVLARPRWRTFLVWQSAEVVLTINRMLLLGGLENFDKGLPRGWWYVTVGIRDITLLVLVGFVVREMLRPRADVVRAGGEDDPAGGVLDGAPDRERRDAGRHRESVLT